MAVRARLYGVPLDGQLYMVGQSRPPDTISAQRTVREATRRERRPRTLRRRYSLRRASTPRIPNSTGGT
jgi:hypothetical protein